MIDSLLLRLGSKIPRIQTLTLHVRPLHNRPECFEPRRIDIRPLRPVVPPPQRHLLLPQRVSLERLHLVRAKQTSLTHISFSADRYRRDKPDA